MTLYYTGELPFQVLNLRYDLTPIKNISVIATESGLIRTYCPHSHSRNLHHTIISLTVSGVRLLYGL